MWLGRQRVPLGLVAVADHQDQFLGGNPDGTLGLSVKNVGGDRVRVVVPDNLGVVGVFPEGNQRSSMRSVVLVAMAVIMLVSGGVGRLEISCPEFLAGTAVAAADHQAQRGSGNEQQSGGGIHENSRVAWRAGTGTGLVNCNWPR